ncbi:hypothetical protein [Variovorax paradoxus]|jgi:hypothetical protein|uniref:hypothetical protein n=1 Tax=Variovorax paradoxus TaxID=34073 RepID=UPI0029C7BCB2|nr:hypothetical protein [Variovorax paradoxus]WPH19409.1 hypothetical protein RZE78_20550 [Variovorax paradoxus]
MPLPEMAKPISFGALLGVALFLGMPILFSLAFPGTGIGHHGEDEAARMLRVYVVMGGAASAALGAWVGGVAATNPRRALGMLAAIGVVSIAFGIVPIQLPMKPENAMAVGIGAWAVVSAGLAALVARKKSETTA